MESTFDLSGNEAIVLIKIENKHVTRDICNACVILHIMVLILPNFIAKFLFSTFKLAVH